VWYTFLAFVMDAGFHRAFSIQAKMLFVEKFKLFYLKLIF